jgi:hypothetical protein
MLAERVAAHPAAVPGVGCPEFAGCDDAEVWLTLTRRTWLITFHPGNEPRHWIAPFIFGKAGYASREFWQVYH